MFNGQQPGIYMPQGHRTETTTTMETSTGAAVMAGTGIEGRSDHLRELKETESNTVKCVPNYRNRLKHVIKFWKENYPGYYDEVVFDLTTEQKEDKHRYWTATPIPRQGPPAPRLLCENALHSGNTNGFGEEAMPA